MSLYHGIKKLLLPGKACHLFISLLSSLNLFAQETDSEASGRVYSEAKDMVAGATLTLTHEPTNNTYSAVTNADGSFYFFNLKPGGPYTLIISSVSYEEFKRTNLFVHLTSGNFFSDNSELADFTLRKKITSLEEVKIVARNNGTKTGIETIVTDATLRSMPNHQPEHPGFRSISTSSKSQWRWCNVVGWSEQPLQFLLH